MTNTCADPELADIAAKVESNTRLTREDGLRLYATRDIHTLGELADKVRRRLHGRTAYYNVNRHINYTNYCVLSCKFCSFCRPYAKSGPQVSDGYELTVEQVVDRAARAYEHGATEVHVVGGLHPRLPFSYYLDLCNGIRERCPKMHIKAFTAIEIIHFARIARPQLTIREVLTQLRDVGLGSLPGGGAEIFDDRVHDEAFKNKVGQTEWFEVHRTAHDLGIFTNATMLYGHVETPAQRIEHLLKLREHQDESLRNGPAHFNCLVPLPFIPEGSALAHPARPHRPGRSQDAGRLPADAGQRPAPQGLLDHAVAQARPGLARLRRGRPRRHGDLLRHHQGTERVTQVNTPGTDRGPTPAADRRNRLPPRRTRLALSPGDPRRRHVACG